MDRKVIKCMNDLYVLFRKKYLIMNEKGEYRTVATTKGKEINITDYNVKNHLLNKYTVGVFAGAIFTKFICFDVDVKNEQLAKWTVYKLVDTLQELGISDEYINISRSGGKGYHVELFFDKPIKNDLIKQFYLMVMNRSELLNIDYGEVELRPTATQGVKIPLGKHFKTGKICWYCDYEKGLEPIKDYKHILTIKKMDSEFFYALMNRQDESIEIDEKKAKTIETIITTVKPLEIYKQNIDEDVTIEAIEKLIEEGLSREGTRHNSLFKIAKYNKYFGLSRQDNQEYLISWMQMQDKRMYSTDWEDVLKDIELIVNWVYETNCSLTVKKNRVVVSAEEMEEILKVSGKNEKIVLYALVVHGKRYATKDGSFYMTYKQMKEATGLNKDTIIQKIKELEAKEMVAVARGKIKYNAKQKKALSEANRYKININLMSVLNDGQQTFNVCEKNCSNCFYACLCSLMNKKDIKKKVSRREYENYIVSIKEVSCSNVI